MDKPAMCRPISRNCVKFLLRYFLFIIIAYVMLTALLSYSIAIMIEYEERDEMKQQEHAQYLDKDIMNEYPTIILQRNVTYNSSHDGVTDTEAAIDGSIEDKSESNAQPTFRLQNKGTHNSSHVKAIYKGTVAMRDNIEEDGDSNPKIHVSDMPRNASSFHWPNETVQSHNKTKRFDQDEQMYFIQKDVHKPNERTYLNSRKQSAQFQSQLIRNLTQEIPAVKAQNR